MLKELLKKILRVTAILMIKKYKPIVIGITGSVGKTSTKEAIYTVLKKRFSCRRSRGNFNNELGLPLTILGDYKEIKGKLFWINVLIKAWLKIIFNIKAISGYPKILILEMAADRPGDIDYLSKIAKPKIGVITAIGEIPVHVEYYSGPEAVAKEKGKLLEALPSDGFAILNRDDLSVFDLKDKTMADVISYGFSEEADIRLGNFEHRIDKKNIPEGISLKVHYGGGFTPMRINGAIGKPQAYAVGAAVAIGLSLNMNLVDISEALLDYKAPPGRLKLVEGVKKTTILDDSYNASPTSMRSAIETMAELPAKRKVAVLGDMLEIGKYSTEAHQSIGDLVGKVVDILFCIGPRSIFIAEKAIKTGMSKDNVFTFRTSDEAKKKIERIIKSGDLILIKGSNAMRLDKILEEIIHHDL